LLVGWEKERMGRGKKVGKGVSVAEGTGWGHNHHATCNFGKWTQTGVAVEHKKKGKETKRKTESWQKPPQGDKAYGRQ